MIIQDNTDSIFTPGAISCLFIPVPIGLFSNKNVLGYDLVAQPVETHVYNRNTYSHFPKLFTFFGLRQNTDPQSTDPLLTPY